MTTAIAGLTGAGDGSLVRYVKVPVVQGQLAIAQGTDPIGGTRLQQVVGLSWPGSEEADC